MGLKGSWPQARSSFCDGGRFTSDRPLESPMSIGIHLDTSTIPLTIASAPAAAPALAPTSSGQSGSATAVTSASGPSSVTIKAPSSDSDSGSSSSSSSAAVKALQKEIAQLQKQLTQEEQALHAAMQAMKGAGDPAGLTVVATLQSAVATTNGQLEMAVTALSTLLLNQGGGSSGSLVNASA